MTSESTPIDPPSPDVGPTGNKPAASESRLIRSEELFAGEKLVRIQHGDEQYRLLITRNNRLILQK